MSVLAKDTRQSGAGAANCNAHTESLGYLGVFSSSKFLLDGRFRKEIKIFERYLIYLAT